METYRAADFARRRHHGTRSCRTTSPARAAACCAGCTFKNGTSRQSSCARSAGEIFDVAVDLRRGSATYGRWVGVRAQRGQPPPALYPARLRARVSGAERAGRLCLQVRRRLPPRGRGRSCAGTMRTSASSGRGRTRPSSAKRINTGRRCARSASSCDAAQRCGGETYEHTRHGRQRPARERRHGRRSCRRGHHGIADRARAAAPLRGRGGVCAGRPLRRIRPCRRSSSDAQPDAVIHCAAWTDVDGAELPENREQVFAVNAGQHAKRGRGQP